PTTRATPWSAGRRRSSARSTRCSRPPRRGRPRADPGRSLTRSTTVLLQRGADMSRTYRVSVSESLSRIIKAEDRVSTQLEIIQVLPPEQMGGLLADDLVKQGFERDGEKLTRTQDGVTVTVDVNTGTVTVSAEASE